VTKVAINHSGQEVAVRPVPTIIAVPIQKGFVWGETYMVCLHWRDSHGRSLSSGIPEEGTTLAKAEGLVREICNSCDAKDYLFVRADGAEILRSVA
jgi:hypothetical protein